MNDAYIKVVLDAEATILDFECTFQDIEHYEPEEVIGKNWFDLFIDSKNIVEVTNVFYDAFVDNFTGWEQHTHDIRCKNNSYKLIDFENQISIYQNKKVLITIGREHFRNS